MARKKKTFTYWRCPQPIFVDRELLTSEAYFSLKTPACYIIYAIFLTKRQIENQGDRYNPSWVIKNNGSITFTYLEALEKYGLSNFRFEKAIANLVDVGLLDITRPGKYKQPTLYALSERWKLYGTDDFIKKEVPKRVTSSGFQKGNKYGRNFTTGEKEDYRQQLKQQKSEELQVKINQLKRDKLAALLEDKQRNRCSRIPAIIDEVIGDYADRLRRLLGT